MPDVSTPRHEFRDELREWFVAAMDADTTAVSTREAGRVTRVEPVAADHPASRRFRGPLAWLGAAAAVVVGLLGLAVFRQPADDSAPSLDVPAARHTTALDDACRVLSQPLEGLPPGASTAAIDDATTHLSERLEVSLEVVNGDTALTGRGDRSLLERAIVTTERLRSLAAGGDRTAIDEAIAQIDQLTIAWAKEMRSLGATACDDVPLLREVDE